MRAITPAIRTKLVAVTGAVLLLAAAVAVHHARASAQRAAAAHPIAAAVSAALGVSPQQLVTDLRSGQTLAQIATANGKPVSGLEQAILSGAQTRLDAAVQSGRLSSQAEKGLLSRLGSHLDALVNVKHPVAHVLISRRLRLAILRISAGYLNLSPPQLRSALQSGKTLAEVATDQGKTAAGLEQAIETALTKRLDAAVSAGKLGPQREQAVLKAVNQRLDALVNHQFG